MSNAEEIARKESQTVAVRQRDENPSYCYWHIGCVRGDDPASLRRLCGRQMSMSRLSFLRGILRRFVQVLALSLCPNDGLGDFRTHNTINITAAKPHPTDHAIRSLRYLISALLEITSRDN